MRQYARQSYLLLFLVALVLVVAVVQLFERSVIILDEDFDGAASLEGVLCNIFLRECVAFETCSRDNA